MNIESGKAPGKYSQGGAEQQRGKQEESNVVSSERHCDKLPTFDLSQ